MIDLLEYPNPEECLVATEFIESDALEVDWCLDYLDIHHRPDREKAIEIFEFVRDELDFTFRIRLDRGSYKASSIIDEGAGFCTQKTIVLCALSRAAGIPSALVFSEIRDQSLSSKMIQTLGTDIIYQHALAALYLGDQWLKVDASLSPDRVIRKAYHCVEFDGMSDALLPATRLTGAPHATYLKFIGAYADLPFDLMMAGFTQAYPHLSHDQLASLHRASNLGGDEQ